MSLVFCNSLPSPGTLKLHALYSLSRESRNGLRQRVCGQEGTLPSHLIADRCRIAYIKKKNQNLKLDSKQLFITCLEKLAFQYQSHIE